MILGLYRTLREERKRRDLRVDCEEEDRPKEREQEEPSTGESKRAKSKGEGKGRQKASVLGYRKECSWGIKCSQGRKPTRTSLETPRCHRSFFFLPSSHQHSTPPPTPFFPLFTITPFSLSLPSMDIDMSLDDIAAANKKPSAPKQAPKSNGPPRTSNGPSTGQRNQAPYSVSSTASPSYGI